MNENIDEREALIRAMLPVVRHIARRIKRMVPGFDLDDLIGDGSVGLIRAVDAFDPERGPSFGHYARRLIVGAMLNGIRRMDPVSERSRRIVRDGENARYAAAVVRGELPRLDEVERGCPGFAQAAIAVHRGQPLSLDARLPEGERIGADWRGDPAFIVERRGERAALQALIADLPERQRYVVLQHYLGERSLRAIGQRMAISAQRASQLHLAAMKRLKRATFAAPH